jgi:hypothetical protein
MRTVDPITVAFSAYHPPVESRERVELALGQTASVDRPPVTAWGHDFLSEWSPTELGASTVARARRYGWDLVKA